MRTTRDRTYRFGAGRRALLGLLLSAGAWADDGAWRLCYEHPATSWEREALPIGNGRLGAMVFGGVDRERIQFNEDSLWIGDEQDTGAYQAFGDVLVTLSESPDSGDAQVGVSNPSEHATPTGQEIDKSVDGDPGTKWCMEHGGRPVVWQTAFPEPIETPLRSYTLTSAEDVPARDPRVWRLLGSDDGADWTLLDSRELDGPFSKRHESRTFTFTNDRTFKSYRFVFELSDKTHFQVSEIALGEPGSDYRTAVDPVPPGSYRRELDIERGVHEVRYTRDGTTYRRAYFASHPAQVLVVHLTADRKGAYTGRVALTDAHKGTIEAKGNRLTSSGSLDGYTYQSQRPYDIVLDYEAQVLVRNEGGELEADGGSIRFRGCDALTILLVADTSYLNQRERGWKGEHPHERITGQLDAASRKPFEALLEEHVRDYQGLYGRLELEVGATPEPVLALPTDERLRAYQEGGSDPDLEELLFQYARYLMISSSRPGGLPANLQGLWNEKNAPPWRSDYHTDVNIQMNYWFVDAANLRECFEPLAEWVYSIREVRRDETREAFGTRGWITHAENGVFGGSTWKWSKGDAAWVAQNLWDHYAFTLNEEYLRRRAYPILKDLCEFWEDHLKRLPDGTLVSPDGFSPEHGPHEDGVSFDQQLVWDLFTSFLEASRALGVDDAFTRKVAALREKLLGPQIGRWGQLQEWMVDRDDPNDKHRHLSHMIAVYPGRQISPIRTPEWAKAARVSLEARGHEGDVGWSNAWKINLWARLHDSEKAYWYVNRWVAHNTFDNLWNACWPGRVFQIDGNFGYAAGVCEMLLQSHAGEIELLPALPRAWPTGEVRGICARGGLEIDLSWKEGRATRAVLRATAAGRYVLRPPPGQEIDGPRTLDLEAGQTVELAFR